MKAYILGIFAVAAASSAFAGSVAQSAPPSVQTAGSFVASSVASNANGQQEGNSQKAPSVLVNGELIPLTPNSICIHADACLP